MRSLGAGAAWSMTSMHRFGFQTVLPPMDLKALMANGAVVSDAIADVNPGDDELSRVNGFVRMA